MSIVDKIVEYIRTNKVSTTEVADCLNKSGVLPNVMAVNSGQFRAGVVKWVYAFNESNWDVHEQIRDTQKGEIVFIEAFDCGDRAIVGELVTKFLLLYRGAEALVTNARMRDANGLIKEHYAVWCNGYSPVGCFNKKNEIPLSEDIIHKHREMYDGAVMVCDDTGVVIIPKSELNEKFYQKLENIERQEDKWFECIDRLKWDTYDTVCLRKYEKE